MKKICYVVAAVLILSVAGPMYAQGGCVNSPENPTAILALVGSAGAFAVGLRSRFRK